MIQRLATGGILRRPTQGNPGGPVAGYADAILTRAGQRMVVEMTTTNPSAYFNVWAPGADAAMFIGSAEGLRF